MTDEMLALARENQAKAGATNVEFLKGTMEEIPLPDGSVDVVISNCVINLAADKDRVLSEAFRVLKPGGRFAVSDVVTKGEIPAPVKKSVELWIGCIAGALDEDDYAGKLRSAGFVDVTVEPTRIYRVDDAREFLASAGFDVDALGPEVDGKFRSASSARRNPPPEETSMSEAAAPKRLNVFRALADPLVALCMVAGVALGDSSPGRPTRSGSWSSARGARINVAIAVLIWLMVYP